MFPLENIGKVNLLCKIQIVCNSDWTESLKVELNRFFRTWHSTFDIDFELYVSLMTMTQQCQIPHCPWPPDTSITFKSTSIWHFDIIIMCTSHLSCCKLQNEFCKATNTYSILFYSILFYSILFYSILQWNPLKKNWFNLFLNMYYYILCLWCHCYFSQVCFYKGDIASPNWGTKLSKTNVFQWKMLCCSVAKVKDMVT